jgi:glycosyltransferase involved in cell wall biosynthesis
VIDVVIVTRDVAETLGAVIAAIPPRRARSVVVVDCGSTDSTCQVARDAGAVVLRSHGGYGAACRRATEHLASLPRPSEVVVFMAGDGRDDPSQLDDLLAPIGGEGAELVVGVRPASAGASPGERVALRLIGAIYRYRFEDMGGFRAIRLPALVALGLDDPGAGYLVQMQVKALRLGLRIAHVPVRPLVTSARAPLGRRLRRDLGHTGKALFHILRHATAR